MKVATHAPLAVAACVLILLGTARLLPNREADHLVASGFSGISPVAASSAAMTLHEATPELSERVDWALERFTAAGLRLPPVDITFHRSGEACHGHPGWIRFVGESADIELCMPTRHVILHELAHAWELNAVDEATQQLFLRYWGLETWRDRGVEWGQRGAEKAAETIAFALNDIPADPSESLLRVLCGYEILTGDAPPRWETESRNNCHGRGAHPHPGRRHDLSTSVAVDSGGGAPIISLALRNRRLAPTSPRSLRRALSR